MELEQAWNSWLRRRAKRPPLCKECGVEVGEASNGGFAAFDRHLHARHADVAQSKPTEEARKEWAQRLWEEATREAPASLLAGAGTSVEPAPAASPASTGSLSREGSIPRSPSPLKRPRARRPGAGSAPAEAENDAADFNRGPIQGKGRLWNPDHGDPARSRYYDRSNVASNHRQRQPTRSSRQSQPRRASPVLVEERSFEIIKQPETRPISQEQLVAEVKGIYAGLVMVESKCIEVDNAQNGQNDPAQKLNDEQWQALIALHRTLLHEHHDFFLASQHPSASPALRRLASKYAMPARMWRHGIHGFLEMLRHRLPASLEHMLAFIYLAYSTMALLFETVPAFEDTWIECLGDLGRYRMAIEDEDLKDREVWTTVSRGWYTKASDKAPTTGRLYHHLAILARPNALQQLFYYSKSLCVANPFASAKDSIMTLFDPVMSATAIPQAKLARGELALVRCHGIIFSRKMLEKLAHSQDQFLDALDTVIGRYTRQWIELGHYVANSACCAVVGYGNPGNIICRILKQLPGETLEQELETDPDETSEAYQQMSEALSLANGTHQVVFRRCGDPNILPYVHCTMVFIYHLMISPAAMRLVGAAFPWKLLSVLLNTLAAETGRMHPRLERDMFPHGDTGDSPRPLPEDFAMRGLPWVDRYLPKAWFSSDKIDVEEKYFEVASMSELRKERILYLGCRIADLGHGKWLSFDAEKRVFGTGVESTMLEIEQSSASSTSSSSPDPGYLPDAVAKQ